MASWAILKLKNKLNKNDCPKSSWAWDELEWLLRTVWNTNPWINPSRPSNTMQCLCQVSSRSRSWCSQAVCIEQPIIFLTQACGIQQLQALSQDWSPHRRGLSTWEPLLKHCLLEPSMTLNRDQPFDKRKWMYNGDANLPPPSPSLLGTLCRSPCRAGTPRGGLESLGERAVRREQRCQLGSKQTTLFWLPFFFYSTSVTLTSREAITTLSNVQPGWQWGCKGWVCLLLSDYLYCSKVTKPEL